MPPPLSQNGHIPTLNFRASVYFIFQAKEQKIQYRNNGSEMKCKHRHLLGTAHCDTRSPLARVGQATSDKHISLRSATELQHLPAGDEFSTSICHAVQCSAVQRDLIKYM